MRRWRSSDEHAADPGHCPICSYGDIAREFCYDGTESWSDDSCARCGATWQTQWKATGFIGLHPPALFDPDLRDLKSIWQDALREIFPFGAGAHLLGRLRTAALEKAWGLPSLEDTPLSRVGGYDVAPGFAGCCAGELYGIASKFVIERLIAAADNDVLRPPSPEEMSAYLSERGYSVVQEDQNWVFRDEDGLAIPISFSSENAARTGAWLHASSILPARPVWDEQTADEFEQSRLKPEDRRRELYLSCEERREALHIGKELASSSAIDVLVAGTDVFLLAPTSKRQREGYQKAYEEGRNMREPTDDEFRYEHWAKHGPDTDGEDAYSTWLVANDEERQRDQELMRSYHYFKGGG